MQPARRLASAHRALALWTVLLIFVPQPARARVPYAASRAHADAMQLARQALTAFLRRDFGTAAVLYGQAAALEPDVAEFAFGQARSLQESGQAPTAIVLFARVVALTPETHPLHGKAKAAWLALQPPPAPAAEPPLAVAPPLAVTPTVVAVAPAPPAVTAPPAPVVPEAPVAARPAVAKSAVASSPWRRPAGIAGLTLGLAAGAAATALAVSASSAQRTLDGHKMADGRFDLSQVSYADAVAAQGSINGRWSWAAAVGGVGLAAIATAIWLLATEPAATPSADLSHDSRRRHDGEVRAAGD